MATTISPILHVLLEPCPSPIQRQNPCLLPLGAPLWLPWPVEFCGNHPVPWTSTLSSWEQSVLKPRLHSVNKQWCHPAAHTESHHAPRQQQAPTYQPRERAIFSVDPSGPSSGALADAKFSRAKSSRLSPAQIADSWAKQMSAIILSLYVLRKIIY